MGIEEIRLETWEEFEETVLELCHRIGVKIDEIKGMKLWWRRESSRHSTISWSSRCRMVSCDYFGESYREKPSIPYYYRLLHRIKPALESFTGKKWELEVKTGFEHDVLHKLDAYEFLVFLRQYGFPSPLLDWTRSPYIAAYFAFISSVGTDVAIYACVMNYNSSVRNYSSLGSDYGPWLGHTLTGASRHFSQQADYMYFVEERREGLVLFFGRKSIK